IDIVFDLEEKLPCLDLAALLERDLADGAGDPGPDSGQSEGCGAAGQNAGNRLFGLLHHDDAHRRGGALLRLFRRRGSALAGIAGGGKRQRKEEWENMIACVNWRYPEEECACGWAKGR